MNNDRQILLINKALRSQRDSFLSELTKINRFIEKKLANIKKIMLYQNEYSSNDNLKLSKTIPALHKNFNLFNKKIDKVIEIEEIEIENLKKTQKTMLDKIEELNQKIKVMNQFKEKSDLQKRMESEKKEQKYLDELTSTKHIRGQS